MKESLYFGERFNVKKIVQLHDIPLDVNRAADLFRLHFQLIDKDSLNISNRIKDNV